MKTEIFRWLEESKMKCYTWFQASVAM